MKNFISTQDWSKSDLQDILDYAKELKVNKFQNNLKNKSVALFLVFFFRKSGKKRLTLKIFISRTLTRNRFSKMKLLLSEQIVFDKKVNFITCFYSF